jgi:membrane-associated phospholipid phosphatase
VPYQIPPTRVDVAIANAISKHTNRRTEQVAGVLSWAADEHVMLAIATSWWLYCRSGPPRRSRDSDHLLLTALAVTAIPHVLKTVCNQRRPDRLTIRGHLNGIPFSGKPLDAFPSGHAMHVGALASAATSLPPAKRNVIWALSAGLALTRVVLLAHWASDIVVGAVLGALTERLLRPLTGYGTKRPPAATGRGHSQREESPER